MIKKVKTSNIDSNKDVLDIMTSSKKEKVTVKEEKVIKKSADDDFFTFEKKEGEQKKDFAQRLAKQYVQDLENKVRQYPEQWFNYYDFWKK